MTWRLRLRIALAVVLLAGPISAHAQASTASAPDSTTPRSNWPQPTEDNRVFTFVAFDQLEGRTNGSNTAFRWDGEGWIGTDFNKLWIKSEGTVANGVMSDGTQEFLYDRPIPFLRYLDWQAGVRLDLDSGPTRAWGAIGFQGLAPYSFEIAPTLYVRDGGRVAGRVEGLYDWFLSQRLVLQPQVEINFYSQADRARGIGPGLSEIDSGIRLGYQFSRKFAPYVGYTYTATFGDTATFSREDGEPTRAPRFVFGIWVWH